eukprot:gene31442-38834_t
MWNDYNAEYIQFCHDYNLKSTSLLTAIQVGEIFLNIVPFNAEASSSEIGMSVDMFCAAIVHMAAIGYRDCVSEITLQSKVRALLLYMWKAVNDNDKTIRMINSTRINAVTSYAGSMNLYGSGLFSDQFLTAWQKDGFPDYTAPPPKAATEDGALMMKKVVAPAAPAPHTIKSLCGSDQPVNLQGSHITQLLRLKPELTEFLHLEIMNMKMGDVHM